MLTIYLLEVKSSSQKLHLLLIFSLWIPASSLVVEMAILIID